MTVKAAAIRAISQMPEDVGYEAIMEELYVRQRIESGLQELDEGRGLPHDKAREKLGRWLN